MDIRQIKLLPLVERLDRLMWEARSCVGRNRLDRLVGQLCQRAPRNAGLVDLYQQAGMNSPSVSTESEFVAGTAASWQIKGVTLDSGAVDSGSTPTTTLRRGLVLARITATGNWTNYDPTQLTNGQNVARALLFDNVNMLDINSNVVANKNGRVLAYGFDVKAAQCFGLDYMARRQLANRIFFDDIFWITSEEDIVINVQTANYQVLVTDNNATFSTKGASGAVTFTLPTLQRGLRYKFYNEVNQNMAVTGALVNQLVTFNNATASTVTFSSAGNLIGAAVEVIANVDATKWLVFPSGANTMTVS